MSRKRKVNGDATQGQNGALGGNAKKELKSYVERIENIEEEITGLNDDRKEVYAEARANGFDTKALRQVLAEKKMDQAIRAEREALCDTYRHALGMLSDLPLGTAAILREKEEREEREKAAEKSETEKHNEAEAEREKDA